MDVEEREISLMDLLLVVAENLKLLVLGSVLVGLLAWGWANILPQNYTSLAILVLPTATATQAASLMVSPVILDPVIDSLKLADGRSMQRARAELASQVKAVVGKDGLLRVDVTAQVPKLAQSISIAVVSTWLKSTVPGEQDRADLEKRLEYAKNSLASVTAQIARLDAEGSVNLNKSLTGGAAGITLVGLRELQARYLGDVLTIPRQLQGVSRDVVKLTPTLPTEPVSPKKGLIAMVAAIIAALGLLLWAFARQAWRVSAQVPELAEKQGRFFSALGLNRYSH